MIHRFINCVFSPVMRTSIYPCRVSVFVCYVLRVGCWMLRRVDDKEDIRALSSFFTFAVAGCVEMVKCGRCSNCLNLFSPAPLPLTEPTVELAAAGAISNFDSVDSLPATVKSGSIKPLNGKYLLRFAKGWSVLPCGVWFEPQFFVCAGLTSCGVSNMCVDTASELNHHMRRRTSSKAAGFARRSVLRPQRR